MAGGMAVGGLVWLVRLEGRINTTDRLADQRDSFLNQQLTAFRNDIHEIKQDVKALLTNGH